MITNSTDKPAQQFRFSNQSDLSFNDYHFLDTPFHRYSFNNIFALGLYDELLSSFPDQKWFNERIYGNKLRFSSTTSPGSFNEFVLQTRSWNSLLKSLHSQNFVDWMIGILEPSLPRGFYYLCDDEHVKNCEPSIRERTGKVPSRLHFEFSKLEPGSEVPAHTDRPQKVATLVLFFTDSIWREEAGGHTLFYRAKSLPAKHNWSNKLLPKSHLQYVNCEVFGPNKGFLFKKTSTSYHAVNTIPSAPSKVRNSFSVSLWAEKLPFRQRLRLTPEIATEFICNKLFRHNYIEKEMFRPEGGQNSKAPGMPEPGY